MEANISNETICSLREQAENDDACVEMLLSQPNLNNAFLTCNKSSLRKKIGDTFRNLKLLKKRNSRKKTSDFLAAPFLPPASAPVPAPDSTIGLKRKLKEKEKEVSVLTSALSDNVGQLRAATESLHDIQEVVKVEKDTRVDTAAKLSKMSEKCKELEKRCSHFSVKNVNKRLKTRDSAISKLVGEKKELEEKNIELQKQVENFEETKSALEEAKSNLRAKNQEIYKMRQKLKTKIEAHRQAKFTAEEMQIMTKEKDKEIAELEAALDFFESDSPKALETFHDGTFTDSIREVCMDLMCKLNVSMQKVPAVIKLILSKLADISVLRLPSKATLSRLCVEANLVVKQHLVSELLGQADDTCMTGATLHQDATTKFSTHVQGMQATLLNGQQMSMGLQEVASGDAEAYFQVFQDAINDLADLSSLPSEEARSRLIASFKSFMNDQCAVNGVLTKKIEDLRKEVLPAVLDVDTMSADDLARAEEMGHFACRMHLLANFATAADKGVLAYEESVSSGQNPHSYSKEDQSGTLRLIRSAAKALTKRGCDKAGVNSYFESFLEGEGRRNKVLTYLGHRFNIMFVDAAAIYFHKEDIAAFLSLMPDPNRLLRSVAWDLDQKVYVSALRALGVISKVIMEPFYKLLIDGKSVLDINSDLQKLQKHLEEWALDGSRLFSPCQIFEAKYYPEKDEVLECLLSDSGDCDMDSLSQVAAELICGELLILFERQAASQLPGGKFSNPSTDLQKLSKNVPAHNQLSERDMASYDNIIKCKPGASITNIEATIMWQNNKTDTWLDGLTEEQRSGVFKEARKKKEMYSKRVKERLERLKKEKLERLKKKQEKKSVQEDNAVESRLKCIREVKVFGGMWELCEVDRRLEMYDDVALRNGLLAQIRYQKVVVKAKGPRQLFQASSDGCPYSLEQLISNLKEILRQQDCDTSEPAVQPGLKLIEDYEAATTAKKVAITQKLLEARRKRTNTNQVLQLLPLFLADPQALVGKFVQHKCKFNGEISWFRGRVTSIKKRTKNSERTEYNVIYDESPDDTWHFPLLLDLRKGDLVSE